MCGTGFSLYHATLVWRDYQGIELPISYHVCVQDGDNFGNLAIRNAELWFTPHGLDDLNGQSLIEALEACSNAVIVSCEGAATWERLDRLPALPESTEIYRSVLDLAIVSSLRIGWARNNLPAGVRWAGYQSTSNGDRFGALLLVEAPAPKLAALDATGRHSGQFGSGPASDLTTVLQAGAAWFAADRLGRSDEPGTRTTVSWRSRRRALPRRVANRYLDSTLTVPAL